MQGMGFVWNKCMLAQKRHLCTAHSRANITIALFLALCCNNFARAQNDKSFKRMNVVFFLVDDLGQRDVGCYGSKFYETPAIDQLAKDGMRFGNAYSTCHVCSPSRASIQTGKYPARTDLTEWLGGRPERNYESHHSAEKIMAIPDEEQTLAETLKSHGYRTAFLGKAHLGKHPSKWGFDESTFGWYRSYHYPFGVRGGNGPSGKKGDYLTDRYTDLAIDFIDRNKDGPFYLQMSHFAVHDPIHGRKDLVAKYEKKLLKMRKRNLPDYILEPNPDGPALTNYELMQLQKNDNEETHQKKRVWWVKQKQDNVEFAAMVEAMDESLGRIRAKLKELGIEKETIIIFTSDNGGMSASNQYLGIGHDRKKLNARFSTSNLPLRGAKGWNYEGGIRVPLIVHWPGQLTQTYKTCGTIVTGTDYYPTLLDMLGLPKLPKQHVDGKSFVDSLKGNPSDRGPIFWHFPHYSNHGYQSPGGAVLKGYFKLLEYYENGSVELFDLKNDIGEKNDISRRRPKKTKELLKLLQDWRKQVDAKMPRKKSGASRPSESKTPVSKNLPTDVAKFAKGWKVRNWGGPNMKPGLRHNWGGRRNVLLTHPRSKEIPCVLFRKFSVPGGRKTHLVLSVNNHPKGDWKLNARVNGKIKLSEIISSSNWRNFRIDLTEYSGKEVEIELENRANDWAFEAGYWSRLQFESFD